MSVSKVTFNSQTISPADLLSKDGMVYVAEGEERPAFHQRVRASEWRSYKCAMLSVTVSFFNGFSSFWVCALARAPAWIPRARQPHSRCAWSSCAWFFKAYSCWGPQRVSMLGARQNEATWMCNRHVSALKSVRRVFSSWRTFKLPYFRNAHLSSDAVGRFFPPEDAYRRGTHFPVLSIQIRYARLKRRCCAARRARYEMRQLECPSEVNLKQKGTT